MNRTSRNRFVAWLGIAAMWLAIVAPVVSQSIAARASEADPQAVICSAEAFPTLDALQAHAEHASHAEAERSVETGAHHASLADHLEACSYCGLLAHHLPLAAAIPAQAVRVERIARVAPIKAAPAVYPKSYNVARSRAPPFAA